MTDSHLSVAAGSSPRRSAKRLHEVRVEIEVPFHDVDALQVVWHGHYYKYLEIARTELLRSRQLDTRSLHRLSVGLMVIESRCRYVSPLRYGDLFQVAAWFRDLRFRIMVEYEITNLAKGSRVARGHTALVTTTPDGAMHYRTPDSVLELLAPHLLKGEEGS
ncbi:MAG: thioesterase family protein [Myxococcota bacterium]|nr:thioesterase family protein [Myxococcota bacterium]